MTDEGAVDASPFDLGERTSRAAALCLHGLTGTPYEVRPLGEALAAAGVRARGPVLPGHGRTPEALAAVGRGAWLGAVEVELAGLREEHERVFVAGLSLGGLLGLAAAARGWVDALAVVGTPLRLHPVLRWTIPLLRYVVPLAPKRSGSDIADEAARRRHPGLEVMPLAAVHELIRLQREVGAALGRIEVPLFVGHGGRDRTARPADAREILARVASTDTELLWVEEAAHVVPVDRGGDRLVAALAAFLARFA